MMVTYLEVTHPSGRKEVIVCSHEKAERWIKLIVMTGGQVSVNMMMEEKEARALRKLSLRQLASSPS